MTTGRKLNEKYGTGQRYINLAAVDYFGNRYGHKSDFWCEAFLADIINEYNEHIQSPPTNRCHQIEVSRYGIFPPKNFHITDAELEWAALKGILEGIIQKEGGNKGQIRFVISVTG